MNIIITYSHIYIMILSFCRCQEQVEGNVKELVGKMLEAEKDEWSEMQPPEQDVDGVYYTTVGITLFQMIDQNVCNDIHILVHVHVATVGFICTYYTNL